MWFLSPQSGCCCVLVCCLCLGGFRLLQASVEDGVLGLISAVVIVDGTVEGVLRLFGVVVACATLRIWAYCVVVVVFGAVVVQPLSVLRMICCQRS